MSRLEACGNQAGQRCRVRKDKEREVKIVLKFSVYIYTLVERLEEREILMN